jgi:hypothetical protein
MNGPKPLIWIVWLGLVMIGVEVRHLHAKILSQPAAALPLVFCGLAVILLPICLLRTSATTRRWLFATFAVGSLLGVVGVYFHTGFRIEPFLQLFTSEKLSGAQPLVPLSLTGLCSIGLLASRLLPDDCPQEDVKALSRQALDR